MYRVSSSARSHFDHVSQYCRSFGRSFSVTSIDEKSMEAHQQSVQRIASTVREFYNKGEGFRIFHGSTNSTRPAKDVSQNIVDASDMCHILDINLQKKTVLVEPNVPMDRLVHTTLGKGLVPPVVMEFPGITVGGGFNGTSGESSSFKHGFFNETINWVEMVLANGDVVKASDRERPDLFYGAAGAVGSLGVTTLVELQLREAMSHVETTYHPVTSVAEAIGKIKHFISDPSLDYVDGILFSKTCGAVITGRMTNKPLSSLPVQTFTNPGDPWFYLHVFDRISRSAQHDPGEDMPHSVTEAIPLWDYLFRYDRGGFWVGRSAFHYFLFPFNRLTRWFLDDFMRTRMMYVALHQSGESTRYVVQDLALPFSTAERFVNYTADTFDIWPLWLCPLRQSRIQTMHPHSADYEADGKTLKPLLNVGLWGEAPAYANLDALVALNQHLERHLRRLGGMKWLYAHTYYQEDEFWADFDRPWYETLRSKYMATSLPSVYDKVRVDVERERSRQATMKGRLTSRWPLGGIYGIWKAIESKEYVKARKDTWEDHRSSG